MIIRQIGSLDTLQLISLALSIPNATLFSGWGKELQSDDWQTLAIPLVQDLNMPQLGFSQKLLERPTISPGLSDSELPPFTTGLIGHFTYEYSTTLEKSIHLPVSNDKVPLANLTSYNATISTHIDSGETFIYATNKTAANQLENRLQQELGRLKEELLNADLNDYSFTSDVSQEAFQSQVESIRQRILGGDFYQANLTRMLSVDLGDTNRCQLAGFAERLLTQSQAPFGAILNFENETVVSASPERFFRIESSPEGRRIFAEPIKGTRPRNEDPELDEALKHELLSSEKDRAENIMIADLVRNDLSRICTDESVIADPVCALRSFKNVHHLVTQVSGKLRDEVSNLDALLAQFPCGSITGAPKWAAMDVIAELEKRGRGIYCGAIGYFDDRGHADFSVAIRTAVANFSESGTKLTYGTGGGITILSDPEEEYLETEDKAAGFFRALQS